MKKAIYSMAIALLANSAIAQTPPATWQEHWFEHNQLLNRVFYNNDLAVYYDNDVNTSITWPNTFLNDVWIYTKGLYGSFGTDPHLFAVFHTNKYSGGHPSTYFDASHDYRNMIDVGPGPWTSGTGGDLDIVTHEVAHIVEIAGKGFHNSPAFGIWGDSKWAEIYIYDVYKALGRTSDVTRWYNSKITTVDNFPRANTYWFRDWFYPIYKNYGGAQTLNRYFTLLAQYFPKNGTNYARSMNWGEFVHFWSGAAGINLKSLATNAFGWPAEYETQFNQARIDFPFTYGTGVATLYQDCNYGGYTAALPPGTYTLSQLQGYGIANDDISSLKVSSGYQAILYTDDNFGGATLTVTGDKACLVNDGWNDRLSSVKIVALSIAARQNAIENSSSTAGAVQAAQETTDKTFALYPNPVNKELNIRTRLAIAGSISRIYDAQGREVLTVKNGSPKINVSALAPGLYTLVFTSGEKKITRQFIK